MSEDDLCLDGRLRDWQCHGCGRRFFAPRKPPSACSDCGGEWAIADEERGIRPDWVDEVVGLEHRGIRIEDVYVVEDPDPPEDDRTAIHVVTHHENRDRKCPMSTDVLTKRSGRYSRTGKAWEVVEEAEDRINSRIGE